MKWILPVLLLGGLFLGVRPSLAGPPLETETARLPRQGALGLDGGFEYQTSSSGTEIAVPIALEYGLTDRLELMAEPVPYTSIRQKGIPAATGIGDLELTGTYLLVREERILPAFAVAGEVKIPTAKNALIGSGKADYTIYLIASSLHGRFDSHANLGYTRVGHPTGIKVNNTTYFAFGEEVRLTEQLDLLGEVYGNTAALPEVPEGSNLGGESVLTPEIGGSEVVGMVGARLRDHHGVAYSLALSYDNNNALLIRPGVTIAF
jgi:hypothetical protein